MNGDEAVRSTSVFLGVDLGWTTGATGLAAVDDTGRLTASGRVQTDDEIAGWIGALPGRVVVAAVDAPLIVPNETGQRASERLIGQAFGGFGASAHTANRSRFPGGDTRAMRLAQRFGWAVDPRMPTGGDVGVCIEVYPHPALVGLFELSYRLDYKKGDGQRRAPGFRLFVRHLESIPQLDLVDSPRWAQLKQVLAAPGPGDLNRVEDELDAIVCAHLAWLWHHRPDTLHVYGDVDAGYIIAPPPPLHRPRQPKRGGGGSAAIREQPRVAGCRCGCEEQVGRGALYRPGHDARHASLVGRAMIAAGAENPALLVELPSEALRAKARAMLDRSASRGRLQPPGTVVHRNSPPGTPPLSGAAPDARHSTAPQPAPDRTPSFPGRPPPVSAGHTSAPPATSVAAIDRARVRNSEALIWARGALPYPIARAARSVQLAADSKEAYEAVLRAAEATTTVLGITATAWARHNGVVTRELDELQEAFTERGISPGLWRSVLVSVGRAMQDHPTALPGMADAVRSGRGGTWLKTDLQQLTEERNLWAHGAGPRTRMEAAERVAQFLPLLERALQELGFLVEIPWLLVNDAKLRRRSNDFQVHASKAMGDHPDFEVMEFTVVQAVAEDVLYLLTTHGLIDLTPLVVMEHCMTCHQRELAYADRIDNKKGVVLKTFDRGHVIFDPQLVEEIRDLIPSTDGTERNPAG